MLTFKFLDYIKTNNTLLFQPLHEIITVQYSYVKKAFKRSLHFWFVLYFMSITAYLYQVQNQYYTVMLRYHIHENFKGEKYCNYIP